MRAFQNEQALASTFMRALVNNPLISRRINSVVLEQEVKGLLGIPDLLLAFVRRSKKSTAFRAVCFELKLSNWQRALVQAYRYAAFADYSFVVLDDATAGGAVANIDKFIRSNIGLITISKKEELSLIVFPRPRRPYSPSTREKLDIRLRNCLVHGTGLSGT